LSEWQDRGTEQHTFHRSVQSSAITLFYSVYGTIRNGEARAIHQDIPPNLRPALRKL
jgi:hypothetical protein